MHPSPPDLFADPFQERSSVIVRKPLQLLGARIRFESNSPELLRLADTAYAGLPRHRFSSVVPRLRVRLSLTIDPPSPGPHLRGRSEPPPLAMLSGAGFLGGSTASSNFVVLSPGEGAALVVVGTEMLQFPYHTRYELIEFAVYTLAARAQRLVPLHAACVGQKGRGILLMGPSGSGKSTVALQCLLHGFDFLAEDSVFVAPETMMATGIANFLHVRSDSLRWVERSRDIAAIRRSPIIRRRSGVEKFEVDLRQGGHRLAASPLKIGAIVFLSQQSAADGPLLRPLKKSVLMARLRTEQIYAAGQPQWSEFKKNLSGLQAYELTRGSHPLQSADILRRLLDSERQ